jgi:hypothetical protein
MAIVFAIYLFIFGVYALSGRSDIDKLCIKIAVPAAMSLSIVSWYWGMEMGIMLFPTLTLSLFISAIFSQTQFILGTIAICWKRYWERIAKRAQANITAAENKLSVGEKATDTAHTAAREAFAAVNSALTITRTWFVTTSQSVHQRGRIRAIGNDSHLLDKMTDAIRAWSTANAMCKSIMEIQDAHDIARLAIQIAEFVSMAKTLSMEAEKAAYLLYRPPIYDN